MQDLFSKPCYIFFKVFDRMRWSRGDGIFNAVDRLHDFFAVALVYWRVLIAYVALKDFSMTSKVSLDVEQFLPEGFILFLDID